MNKRLLHLAAGIALTAAAITGYTLTDDTVTQPAGDTTWGAPTTTSAVADDNDTSGTDATHRDTTWG